MVQVSVTGYYFYPNSSQHVLCTAALLGEHIQLLDESGRVLVSQAVAQTQVTSPVASVAQTLSFIDGGRFVAQDTSFRWPFTSKSHALLEKLEKNKLLIIASVLLTPLLVWFILYRAVPAVAVYSINQLSPEVIETMGEQSFSAVEKVALSPSEIALEKQQKAEQQWSALLSDLNLDQSKYRLSFYKSDMFGANAFAMPHGRVVVTDELMVLLAEQPDALRAILLHEIGHVHHQHGIKLVAQSLANTIVLAMLFGDLETVGELVLGSGSSLMQQAFSRDMEREADQFAIEKLVELGFDANDFADAIDALHQHAKKELDEDDTWLQYLSSHPHSQERIDSARNFDAQD